MAIEQLAEEVVNEVATNLEEAAEVTRKINAAGLGYLAVGLGIGAAVGFYFGYKFNREKIRAEAYKETQVEVTELRQAYMEKIQAERKEDTVDVYLSTADPANTSAHLHGSVSTEKPAVEDIIRDRGYSAPVPPRERPLPAPVPILDVDDIPEGALDDLPENPSGTSKSMNAGWNYEKEAASRSPDNPYIIHQNEFNHSNLNYAKTSFVYFSVDEVLVDNDDETPLNDVEIIVGLENLRFGHGSDDTEIVYVRNDELEMDMQITRVNRSYTDMMLSQADQDDLRDDSDDDDDDDDDS